MTVKDLVRTFKMFGVNRFSINEKFGKLFTRDSDTKIQEFSLIINL